MEVGQGVGVKAEEGEGVGLGDSVEPTDETSKVGVGTKEVGVSGLTVAVSNGVGESESGDSAGTVAEGNGGG